MPAEDVVLVQTQAQWNPLDPLVLDAALRHIRGRKFYHDPMAARELIEPQAAQQGTPRAMAARATAFADMVESESHDTESWSAADLAFHTAIIEASGNGVLRHLIIAIRAAL